MSNITGGNKVKVELDPENTLIETTSGFRLHIDTSFEPEKHVVRAGTVKALPTRLHFDKKNSRHMPWDTDMELKIGDRVVMYYLAVMNCISKDRRCFSREKGITSIFIGYQNIYAIIRDGEILPINGYVLVEHAEDPAWEKMQDRIKKSNLEVPDLRVLSKTDASYGTVAYVGKPNKAYFDSHKSDDHIDIKVGDKIIMKKVRDIPAEYEWHAKIDKGRKLYRMQRHDILGVL